VVLLVSSLFAEAAGPVSRYQSATGGEVSFVPLTHTDLPAKTQQALVRIEFDVPDLLNAKPGSPPPEKRGHCSGVYVSKSRDILTAAHCFDHCLFKSPHSTGQNQAGKTCSVRINGEPTVVQVKVSSQCPLEKTHDWKIARALGKPTNGIPALCASQNDIAIVRPLSPLRRPFACLPLQGQTFLGENVFTIGHPGYSSRSDERLYDSDGKRAYYSRGSIVRKGHCALKQRWDSTKNLSVDGVTYPVGSFVKLPNDVLAAGSGKIQSTVDLVEGSSGSPLINVRGEIVGIASFVFTDAQGPLSQCEGASFFEPAANAVSAMRASGRFPASTNECN
jgi:hypothetical protein